MTTETVETTKTTKTTTTIAQVAQDGGSFFVVLIDDPQKRLWIYNWPHGVVSDYDMLAAFFAKWWFIEQMSYEHPDWVLDFNSNSNSNQHWGSQDGL